MHFSTCAARLFLLSASHFPPAFAARFLGVVESSTRTERGVHIYSVRLRDGEIAEDVEGSEIRPQGAGDSKGSSSDGGEHKYARTRDDALSGFDQRSLGGASFAHDDTEVEQLTVRATDSGIEWNFIDDEQIGWSPPTQVLLQQHLEQQRKREELCVSPP